MKFNDRTQVFALISLLIYTQLRGGIARASVTSFEKGYLLVGRELIMVEFAQTKDEQEPAYQIGPYTPITLSCYLFMINRNR